MHIQQWFSAPLFDEEQCERIVKICKSDVPTTKAQVITDGSSIDQIFSRNCKSGWLFEEQKNQWIFDAIKKAIIDINDRTFRFEVDHMEPLQYLEYGPLQFYNKHVDNGDDAVATRKLSAVIQLSDPKDYLGGSLAIDSNCALRHAPRGRGRVVIFPSHLPHKANPVWIGKRKVLVAWIRGTKPLS